MNHDSWHPLSCALLASSIASAAAGQGFDLDALTQDSYGDSRDVVTVTFTSETDEVTRGTTVVVDVTFEMKRNWHIWPQEGGAQPGTAIFDGAVWTEIDVVKADGLSVASITWPETHLVAVNLGFGAEDYSVFEGTAVARVELLVAADAPEAPTISLSASFQACDDSTCLAPTFDPPIGSLTFTTGGVMKPVAPPALGAPLGTERAPASEETALDAGTPVDAAPTTAFFGFELPRTGGVLGGVILVLLGIVGGFILNLTPCVLPVIPIKIMTLSQHAATPGRALSLGLWMALGVFAFWFAIGLPVVFFASITDPSRIFGIWWVTFAIGALIGVMGIGIMGLFTLSLPQSTYLINPKADNAWGSFLFGVMTAVLGLPCFGFVAGALFAGAATLPPFVTLMIFGSIGIGMGAPYLVLSAYPKLVDSIPRTGPASELVKQVMGLLLLAAAAYFIGSGLIGLVAEQPWMARLLHWWAIAIALILAGGWLTLRTFQITPRWGPRITWLLVSLVLGVVPTWYSVQATEKARLTHEAFEAARLDNPGRYLTNVWNLYDPITFEAARSDGKTVVVDFTAEWCINCKALKAGVLDVEPVKSRLADSEQIVMFTADNTSRKAPGWELMREIGQTGIPLLAIWSPTDPFDAPWQSTAYTSNQVMEALGPSDATAGDS
ncbi:MAG: thioredoxin family protein [Planctomycetota bacterium]|nr:thioredoxin family protein [Planctomycetota bacterium]